MQVFGREIGAVFPRERLARQLESFEVLHFLQRLKNRAGENVDATKKPLGKRPENAQSYEYLSLSENPLYCRSARGCTIVRLQQVDSARRRPARARYCCRRG